jgi:carbon storage regulator CsrA
VLVLSRKINESIIVGDAIEITVRRVSRGRVVLGLNAPHDVSIVRGELDRRLENDTTKPASTSIPPPDHSVEACAR